MREYHNKKYYQNQKIFSLINQSILMQLLAVVQIPDMQVPALLIKENHSLFQRLMLRNINILWY